MSANRELNSNRVTFSQSNPEFRNNALNSSFASPPRTSSAARGGNRASAPSSLYSTSFGDSQDSGLEGRSQQNTSGGASYQNNALDRTIQDLDSKITSLKQLFRASNPMEDRARASTIITAQVGGGLDFHASRV